MRKIIDKIKGSAFWKVYVCILGAFLLLLIIGMIILSVYLSDYQDSQNTIEVDRVLSLFKEEKFDEILKRTDVVMTGFVSEKEYEEKIREAVKDKELTYSKAFSYDRFESPAFMIEADGEDLCKVTLKKSKSKSKFGFDLYEFDYVSDFSFADVNVVLLAPDGTEAYIDGKKVDDVFKKTLAKDQITDTGNTLNGRSTVIYRYEICGLLVAPENVEVKNKAGEFLKLHNNSNNEVVAETITTIIHAPAEFEVTVNGYKLNERFKTGEDQSNPYIKYLLNEEERSSLNTFYTYEVKQLTEKPEIKVKDSHGNDIGFVYEEETKTFEVGLNVFTIQIPSNYTLSVNGKNLTSEETWLAEKNAVIKELENIPAAYFTKPYMNTYKVAVLKGDITIEAKNFMGETVPLNYDEKTFTYSGFFNVTSAETGKYHDIAITGAKKYAGFMSNDIGKSDFLKEIVSGTQMYKDMNEYRQYWYTDHDSASFENVEAYDLRVYGENCFSCAVYFDYHIYGQRGNPNFHAVLNTNTRIWYVNKDGRWYMSDIEIFERE